MFKLILNLFACELERFEDGGIVALEDLVAAGNLKRQSVVHSGDDLIMKK